MKIMNVVRKYAAPVALAAATVVSSAAFAAGSLDRQPSLRFKAQLLPMLAPLLVQALR